MARVLKVHTEYGLFTRQSDRPYLYVVGSKGMVLEYERKQYEDRKRYSEKLSAEYRATAAAGGTVERLGLFADHPYVVTPEQYLEWAESNDKKAAEPFHPTPDDHVVEHGWSQSLKGAQSAANRARKFGFANVKIFGLDGKEVK